MREEPAFFDMYEPAMRTLSGADLPSKESRFVASRARIRRCASACLPTRKHCPDWLKLWLLQAEWNSCDNQLDGVADFRKTLVQPSLFIPETPAKGMLWNDA